MPPTPPTSRNGQDQVVVAGVEVEPARDDVARRFDARLRLLDGADVLDLRQPRDRLRLGVDDDPRRDVVEDDRPVGRGRDRLDVRDDPALRRLVVVRRHDEEAVDPSLVRALGEVDRVGSRVRARPRDDRAAVADGVDGCLEEPCRSSSVSVGASPVVPATTIPSEPLSSRNPQAPERRRGRPSRRSRNGVTIAVRTSPSTLRDCTRRRPLRWRSDVGALAPGERARGARRDRR